MTDVRESGPYRAIVALGAAALPACKEALRDGDFHMARAALEIAGLSAASLAGEEFPSEQATAEALLAWWDRGPGHARATEPDRDRQRFDPLG